MAIDPRMVKWDDETETQPKIDPRMVRWNSPQQASQTSTLQNIAQGAGDLAAGVVRGAGSIGATIMTPFDYLARKAGVENSLIGRSDRRQAMDGGLQELGADPNSMMYKTGKLGGEIAGTAGAGGALANGLGRLAPALANAPILQSIASSGMKAGNLGGVAGMTSRAIGGATTGGISSAMIDPETAGTGAMYGAALPPVLAGAGKLGSLARKASSGAVKHTIGMTTGAGADTFSNAYRAGKEGGTAFLDNMRGNVPMTDVLDSAKDALSKMRADRGNQYRSGMIDIANDKSVIDFAPIDKVAKSLQSMGSFKGQVINKNAAGTVNEIAETISQWKGLNPAEYHTPEGLDALKKAIGDIRDSAQFGTPARKAADTAYNAIKSQIEFQAPTYAKVMKDYGQASQTLSEIEKALSLGNKASADTSMRKLQSLMRNNVNTNYGNRLNLAKTLEDNGADILPALAGQAASSFTPRGLQGLAASGVGATSLLTWNPATLAALPFTSPRLMGEAAYGLGAANRGIKNAVSRIPLGTRNIGNSQSGLLQLPEELQQFGYQALPAVTNNFNR